MGTSKTQMENMLSTRGTNEHKRLEYRIKVMKGNKKRKGKIVERRIKDKGRSRMEKESGLDLDRDYETDCGSRKVKGETK